MRQAIAAFFASLLPYRWWDALPPEWPLESGALQSGIVMVFAGAAIGIPGFLEHMMAVTSLGTDALIAQALRGHEMSVPEGYASLSLFSFLLLTPKGWATMYLMGTGTLRAAASYFEDPVGDPILTGLDDVIWRLRTRARARRDSRDREALEGPEIADRVVTGTAAGVPDCDLVIVSSRRKDGWDRGSVIVSSGGCYRLGDPIERTVAGHLRTLYPLTEHRDLEVFRRPIRYELPPDVPQ